MNGEVKMGERERGKGGGKGRGKGDMEGEKGGSKKGKGGTMFPLYLCLAVRSQPG